VLRGCVGTLEPARPLYVDVLRNATRAMVDPRLPEVTAADWPTLDLKVSVLRRPVPLPVNSRRELLDRLRPGIDGVLLTGSGRRATFLPAVWRKLPDPDKFLSALLVKGGWPGRGWPAGVAVAHYTCSEFADLGPRATSPGTPPPCQDERHAAADRRGDEEATDRVDPGAR
jgi:AmmeMemoRadiSam system protein A